jgi:hypothetical protein
MPVDDQVAAVESATPSTTPAPIEPTAEVPPPPRTTRRSDTASAAPSRAAVLIPEAASGTFETAAGGSAPAGSGATVTYSVEVEEGLPFRASAVARIVEGVLADDRGWTAVAHRSLQRVETDPDYRIRLASPGTTDKLCAPLDTGGRLSCRNGQNVVLNAWRWANGADAYADDLPNYRRYMVNHEFGHALGNSHASCPGPGEPAPVMVQQTKGLDSCVPNPWPANPT